MTLVKATPRSTNLLRNQGKKVNRSRYTLTHMTEKGIKSGMHSSAI